MENTAWTHHIWQLWSNTRERTQSKEKEQAEDSSYPKGIEGMLREAARKSYPEDVDTPTVVPKDYEARQSGRVLRASEHRSLDPTDRSILALSYFCDYS